MNFILKHKPEIFFITIFLSIMVLGSYSAYNKNEVYKKKAEIQNQKRLDDFVKQKRFLSL